MGFAGARGPHEDDVIFLVHKGEVEEIEDLIFIDGLGEVKVEGVDCFDGGEAGLEDPGFDEPLLPGGDFLRGQEVADIRGGEFFALGFAEGIVQSFGEGFGGAPGLFKFVSSRWLRFGSGRLVVSFDPGRADEVGVSDGVPKLEWRPFLRWRDNIWQSWAEGVVRSLIDGGLNFPCQRDRVRAHF
jgi:hypothetical protein